MNKKIRILSIDGGGIRGILPGMILAALEEELKKQDGNPQASIAEYFDLVAGTSTGGILTCALLIPDDAAPNKPKFTAAQAVDLYLKRGGNIFHQTAWHKITSAGGLTEEKYTAKGLEKALRDYFGEASLSSLLKPALISAYNVRDASPFFFKSHQAKGKLDYNYKLTDVARGTSAAPTYFECAEVKSFAGEAYPLIDGGVFVNNPALCAYAEARTMQLNKLHAAFKTHSRAEHCPTADDMVILSLGTGSSNSYYNYKEVKGWGTLEWIRPIINIMMGGVSETVDFQLKQIFGTTETPQNYIRLEPSLEKADVAMDDASPENLKKLQKAGEYNAQVRFKGEIERIASLLIANKVAEKVPQP